MSDNKEEVFLTTTRVLKKNGINYWACNGTLLGIIRDSKLISWDRDIDLAIFGTLERNKIIEILNATGYKLIDHGNSSEYVTFVYKDVKIDINFFIQRDTYLSSLWRVTKDIGITYQIIRMITKLGFEVPKNRLFWTLAGYKVPLDYVFPLSSINYKGEEISIPGRPIDTLEYTYGPDWNIPKPEYNWRKDGYNNVSI